MQNERPDLLRDRRLELGLPPTPPPLRPARGLVLLGSGVGLLLVLVVAAFQWANPSAGAVAAGPSRSRGDGGAEGPSHEYKPENRHGAQ